MPYDIRIRDNATGEIRVYHETGEWDDVQDYIWFDGNCACDCNRGLFFARANNENNPNQKCGSSRYTVLDITIPGDD